MGCNSPARAIGTTSNRATVQRLLLLGNQPGAAQTPIWRVPPPSILRKRCTLSMKERGPATMDPTGDPRPYRHTEPASVLHVTMTQFNPYLITYLCRELLEWLMTHSILNPINLVDGPSQKKVDHIYVIAAMNTSELT